MRQGVANGERQHLDRATEDGVGRDAVRGLPYLDCGGGQLATLSRSERPGDQRCPDRSDEVVRAGLQLEDRAARHGAFVPGGLGWQAVCHLRGPEGGTRHAALRQRC